jgi:hypothetical protein
MRPITLGEAQRRDYPKPICRHCYVTCDWRSYEYRATKLCPYCYDSLPPLQTVKKEYHPCHPPKP